MEKENIVGSILEKPSDRKIIGWSQEQLGIFFATDSGKVLLEKANNKTAFLGKYFQITRDYKTIDKLFYVTNSRPDHRYWTLENGLSRTPLVNLTKLLFVNSEHNLLNLQEQKDFFEDNITPLWKFVYGKEMGVKINGWPGIYLSKEEYINTVYLLENILKDDSLNLAKVGITRKLSDSGDFLIKNIPIG